MCFQILINLVNLPDIQMPQTAGDMGFNVILAADGLKSVVQEIKDMLEDGVFTSDEFRDLAVCTKRLKAIGSRILSAATYAEQNILLKERNHEIQKKASPRGEGIAHIA